MRHEASASLGRIVPLVRVCELTGMARSSVYAQRSATVRGWPCRRGPKTAWSDVQLTERIRAVLAASPLSFLAVKEPGVFGVMEPASAGIPVVQA